ncbi:MAG: non-homologous end joining protein Ku [Acidimicrobiales bacterium]
MPRAVWSGAISFGLVSIPVKLYGAVSPKTVRFNQIDKETGSRVRQRLVAEADGREVSRDEIVKGYEIRPGDYVLVDESDLASLDPKAEHTIDIEEFIDLEEVDPVYFDKGYWLAPDPATVKPYALLTHTMAESGKVAIARFVMRSRQQLAAIRPVDGRLMMSTMHWADEVVDPAELPGMSALDEIEVSAKEQKLADQLLESMTSEFDADAYRDTHREQVMALISRKAEGDEMVTAGESGAHEAEVVDLMEALQASVKKRGEAKGRHPTAKAAAAKKAPAKKAPAKKASAKKPPAKKQASPSRSTRARKSA